MVQKKRTTRCWAVLAAMPVILTTGCPFEATPLDTGTAMSGGGGGALTGAGSSGETHAGAGGIPQETSASTGGGNTSEENSGGGGSTSSGSYVDCTTSLPESFMGALRFTSAQSCYAFVSEEKTWDNAKDACESGKAHLATFSDENDYKDVLNWLNKQERPFYYNGVWIGGKRTEDATDEWHWFNGEPWEIAPCGTTSTPNGPCSSLDLWGKWNSSKQPSGNGDCIQLGVWYGWTTEGLDDDDCYKSNGYLCEWHL